MVATPAMATTWRKVTAVRGFPGLDTELRNAAERFPGIRVHHLCVVVADDLGEKPGAAPADRVAWVHWREARQIDAYLPTRYARIDGASLWGGASINLRSDVVSDASRIKGSVSRVTFAYVNRIITVCRLHGEQLVIRNRHG